MSAPQVGPTRPLAIEDDLRGAIALSRLSDWISAAQDTLERLDAAKACDARLEELLRRYEIFGPDDSPNSGAGLQWLQMTIQDHLRGIERAAGLAAKA